MDKMSDYFDNGFNKMSYECTTDYSISPIRIRSRSNKCTVVTIGKRDRYLSLIKDCSRCTMKNYHDNFGLTTFVEIINE